MAMKKLCTHNNQSNQTTMIKYFIKDYGTNDDKQTYSIGSFDTEKTFNDEQDDYLVPSIFVSFAAKSFSIDFAEDFICVDELDDLHYIDQATFKHLERFASLTADMLPTIINAILKPSNQNNNTTKAGEQSEEPNKNVTMENALKAFCDVCGCEVCAEKHTTCPEYKDFKRQLES